MIVFGIDPGSHKTGWGAIEARGNQLRVLGFDVIRAPADAPLARRVESIFGGLRLALDLHRPERVVMESIFTHKNARSALVLGHARGVALLAAQLARLEIAELSPAEVKKAVTGSGRADKSQVGAMVKVLLGLDAQAPEDASDALAVAIAGAARARSPIAALSGRRR